jgi:hypothetical protein
MPGVPHAPIVQMSVIVLPFFFETPISILLAQTIWKSKKETRIGRGGIGVAHFVRWPGGEKQRTSGSKGQSMVVISRNATGVLKRGTERTVKRRRRIVDGATNVRMYAQGDIEKIRLGH